MATVLFTGFPGFLGSRLLPRVLERRPDDRAVALVQGKFAAAAREALVRLEQGHPGLRGRVALVEGDITRPGLGLEEAARLAQDVCEVYHLAAVYDLAVEEELARRVNVEGTRHVLDLAASCPRLERFQYVSTCYVSGRYEGEFGEDQLVEGQRFNNFYESTKHAAEVLVQERMEQGLPATVYRPAVVVGDSKTGATQKLDGPYYVIQWVLRQPAVALVPVVGDTRKHWLNVVPSDFVVAAMGHLSGLPGAVGRVYQLADPEPLSVDELLDEIGRSTRRRLVRLPLPSGVAKGALDYVPFVERFMGLPAPAVDYFTHPTRYRCDNTLRDLAGTGVRCPPLATYLDRLVDFVRAHPDIGAKAMA